MKKVSSVALALAMLSGAAIVSAPPAAAKKKEEAPAGPQLSREFGEQFEKAKAAFTAKDDASAATAVAAAEGLAKTDDEKFYALVMRYQLNANRAQANAQATNGVYDASTVVGPLDAILANPKLPADKVGLFAYERGRIAFRARQYPLAIQMFNRARAAGSTETDLPLLIAGSKIESGDVSGAMSDFEAVYASGRPLTEDQYRFVFGRAYGAKLHAETLTWLRRWVTAYPSARNWHDALSLYGFSQKPMVTLDKSQLVDLFRLMRQTHALADQNSYEAFALRLSNSGLPEETKAVVDEGRASGKLPAGSPAIALGANAAAQLTTPAALASLTSKAGAAANGQLSEQTADVYLGRGEYAQAITLYRQALAKGGINADQVNTDLGIALAMSGDKVAAKTAFDLVKTAPRSEIAAFWTTWLDHPATN